MRDGRITEHGVEWPDALSALRRFARTAQPVERCELCGGTLGDAHPHLLEREARKVICSCDACAILFCGQQGARYLRIPRKVTRLEDFALTDLEWESLMLPINLAFFFRGASGRMTAMYPSPGGAIESQLSLDAWGEIFGSSAALNTMAAEVEALLVNRVGPEPAYFIVPIDECFRLVGLIRMKWRGLSGGTEVWGAISGFLRELEAKSAGGNVEVRYA